VSDSTEGRSAAAGRWDLDAIRAGGAVCLVTAVPITVIAAIVDSDSGAVKALFFFGAMFGFVVGGGCAAWIQRTGTPISHSVVTAGGAYAVAQAIFILARLIGGQSVLWFGAFFTLGLVLCAGVVGGVLGSRLQSAGIAPSARTNRNTGNE
jgi:hypothetical protein